MHMPPRTARHRRGPARTVAAAPPVAARATGTGPVAGGTERTEGPSAARTCDRSSDRQRTPGAVHAARPGAGGHLPTGAGRCQPPGQARPVDRPAEPRTAVRTAQPGDHHCARATAPHRRAVPGSQRVQAGQRSARTRHRRPLPAPGGRTHRRDRRCERHRGALRRRRVRGGADRIEQRRLCRGDRHGVDRSLRTAGERR